MLLTQYILAQLIRFVNSFLHLFFVFAKFSAFCLYIIKEALRLLCISFKNAQKRRRKPIDFYQKPKKRKKRHFFAEKYIQPKSFVLK